MIGQAVIHGLGPAPGRQPLTATVPPALTPIGGRPLLDHTLDRLAVHGVARVLLSVHRQRAAFEAHLATRAGGPAVEVLAEPEPLGALAALAAARMRLAAGPVFAVRADALWFDGLVPALDRMARAWDPGRMDALLLLQAAVRAFGDDGPGDYFLDPAGRARRRRGGEIASHVQAGVMLIDPRCLPAPSAPDAALWPFLDALEEDGRLWAIAHDGIWCRLAGPEAAPAIESQLGLRPASAMSADARPGPAS
jgi:MurNAc alpha-1-phosphate uridylyltransferase